MNRYGDPRPAVTRFATLLLVLCTSLALANLPADDLPLGWLLAFTLPGAALGAMRGVLRRPWLRLLAAVGMQTGACYLALLLVGPMTRPAALACTILPPLAFATARQEDADRALALFLSFCVLLVGVILDGVHGPLLAGYGAAACLSLRCSAYTAAVLVSRAPQALRPASSMQVANLASTFLVTVYCLFATFAFDRALAWLPSPAGPQQVVHQGGGAVSDRNRRQGLDDSFVLGSGGLLAGLSNEQLLRVRSKDGTNVPGDLYLRSGFFTAPSLDQWQIGPLRAVPLATATAPYQRASRPGSAVRVLEIERFSGAMNFVFAPPATCEIRGLDNLAVDYEREWVRQRDGGQDTSYTVAYQSLPPLTNETGIDARALALGLDQLPRGLDRAPFEALLDRWGARGDAQTVMARIADGLAGHCRYDRAEPAGPFRHSLENFLFVDGDRRGYCMYFASAAALMLRMRGIPCRIGVGLHGGSPDRTEAGARMYGSQNAHAWVEVPFEDRGYVIFDPTPPSERGRGTLSRLESTGPEENDGLANTRSSWSFAAVLDWLMQGWVFALILVLALGFAMLPGRRPAPPKRLEAPALRNARRHLTRLLHALANAGHGRSHRQTLEAYAQDLRTAGRLLPEVADALQAYQDVRFGGFEFDPGREERLLRGVRAAQRLADQQAVAAGSQ